MTQPLDREPPSDADASSPDAACAGRLLSRWWAPAIGVAAVVTGLAPWLVTGARLPLQNLWGSDSQVTESPIALLPFSQYTVTLLFALIVSGAAVGGIVARALRSRMRRGGTALALTTVVVLQLAAIAQTAIVTGDGLRAGTESTVYLVALTTGATASAIVGVAVFVLISRAPRAGALIGLAVAAIAAGPWAAGLVVPFGSLGSDLQSTLMPATTWIPPVLTGAAIAWAGANTVGRVLASAAAVVLIWLAPALVTGLSSAVGTRVLAHDLSGMADDGVSVFRMALFIPELTLRPVLAAALVAAIGLGTRALRTRRGTGIAA